MANRSIINPELLTAIGKKVVVYYEVVDITVTLITGDRTYHITNAPRDLVIGGNTYNHFGQLLDFGSIEENAQFNIGSLDINISGIAPIDPVLNDNLMRIMLDPATEYLDRPVRIQRAYFDLSGSYIDSIEVFSGYITNAAAKRTPESISVGVSVASHWADFDRITGRKTNTSSQQFWYPGDTGLDYCIEVQKDIKWAVPG